MPIEIIIDFSSLLAINNTRPACAEACYNGLTLNLTLLMDKTSHAVSIRLQLFVGVACNIVISSSQVNLFNFCGSVYF